MNFSHTDLLLLGSSSILLMLAFLLFKKGRQNWGVGFLFFCSLGLSYFMAQLDPYLNLWDERFHALVAKNLLLHPFKPTLYEHPLFPYEYRIWAGNHVWLHKQPLFLWQMALSIKFFGINEIAIRLPSVFMHSLLTLLIYRIGKITITSQIGFYGAAFFSVAYYPLELVVGNFPTDHNDFSFLFYVTATFWAWIEYRNSSHPVWIFLVGLFAGMSILVKWLVGLLIFPLWGLVVAWDWKNQGFQLSKLWPLLVSFGICCLTFLPWQIYILNVFPVEAQYEFNLNTEHFYKAVENHGGDFWFHFRALKNLYGSGDAVPFILLGCFIYFISRMKTDYQIIVLGAVLTVYGFYSLATTKMVSFCLIVSPFGFLAIGSAVAWADDFLSQKIPNKRLLLATSGLIFLMVCVAINNFNSIQQYHTLKYSGEGAKRKALLEEMKFIQLVDNQLKFGTYAVFNADVNLYTQISLMFYTRHLAYDFIPNQQQIETARKHGYKVCIRDDGKLQADLVNDKGIEKLQFKD